jgi:membrane dipeptidase
MLKSTQTKITVATAFPVPDNEDYLNKVTNHMIESDFLKYQELCKQLSGWQLINSTKDIEDILLTPQKFGLLMHIEGLNAVTDSDWEMLNRWYGLGWRSLGIVWNVTNSLGGGTKDPVTSLTTLGAKLIEWCEAKGMLVDFAHMNAPTFAAAAKIVNRPILISHGNACALCQNPRNYTDDQLRQVAASNGVIGIFFARTYVTGTAQADISDVANHIDYIKNLIGIDHVALGTDFGGIITGHVNNLDSLDKLPGLWNELKIRGYTELELEKIAWKNAVRILKQHLTPYVRHI